MFNNYNLEADQKSFLAGMANQGLAKSTWSSYKTAERMLSMCRKHSNRKLELPMTKEDVLVFVHWLLAVRKVKAGTVKNYLAGLRQLHIGEGIDSPVFHSDLVKLVLAGKTNSENIIKRRGEVSSRLPMTMNRMRLLKESVRAWDTNWTDKLLLWAVCSIAFHGAFRVHELLSRNETEFDPDFVLLKKDVQLKSEAGGGRQVLELTLRCPKENKSAAATVVEVFETKGSLCPVKAYSRWRSKFKGDTNLPCFRWANGTPLTGRKFNVWLKERTESFLVGQKGFLSSHSFRIGLATTMASVGLGDDDIKEAGRWCSRAYEVYIRLPRKKRRKAADIISKIGMC